MVIKGNQVTRNYESVGESLFYLNMNSKRYGDHLDLLSEDVFKKFQTLKEDYKAGNIDYGTYRDFLQMISGFFRKYEAWIRFSDKLGVKEIQAELKAQGL